MLAEGRERRPGLDWIVAGMVSLTPSLLRAAANCAAFTTEGAPSHWSVLQPPLFPCCNHSEDPIGLLRCGPVKASVQQDSPELLKLLVAETHESRTATFAPRLSMPRCRQVNACRCRVKMPFSASALVSRRSSQP